MNSSPIESENADISKSEAIEVQVRQRRIWILYAALILILVCSGVIGLSYLFDWGLLNINWNDLTGADDSIESISNSSSVNITDEQLMLADENNEQNKTTLIDGNAPILSEGSSGLNDTSAEENLPPAPALETDESNDNNSTSEESFVSETEFQILFSISIDAQNGLQSNEMKTSMENLPNVIYESFDQFNISYHSIRTEYYLLFALDAQAKESVEAIETCKGHLLQVDGTNTSQILRANGTGASTTIQTIVPTGLIDTAFESIKDLSMENCINVNLNTTADTYTIGTRSNITFSSDIQVQNVYKLEDMLLLAFENEILHLAFSDRTFIKNVTASAYFSDDSLNQTLIQNMHLKVTPQEANLENQIPSGYLDDSQNSTVSDNAEELAHALTKVNETLQILEDGKGNTSAILLNPNALDWVRPSCAITNHTYYPAILSFNGLDDYGNLEVSCGRTYRKYDSKTGLISSIFSDDLLVDFYDDGSVQEMWTNETGVLNYNRSTLFYPAAHESNLTIFNIYEDPQAVNQVHRSTVPRWLNAWHCRYYKEFESCIERQYLEPLKLALVVLHWEDTDPNQIDMYKMRDTYADSAAATYWRDMSYDRMKPIEFSVFGPANINLNEKYEVESPDEAPQFCTGKRLDNGVLVREGGGCGMLGCTYISPNVVSGLYSGSTMATNISSIPGYSPDMFFGTVFLTYSTKGCGGAGLFNSVFRIWIGGQLHIMRAISMSHMQSHLRCLGDQCTMYNEDDFLNVEPVPVSNYVRPDDWVHPLDSASMVEIHELIHLFGVSWHSSSKSCDNLTMLYTDCRHREYGNEFSLVGGAGAALELPANERYHLHFLNSSDILIIDRSGSYAISPISNALAGTFRCAAIVTEKHTFWVEYRRPVGYDTSLIWGEYSSNTEGLMITLQNSLIDLRLNTPNEQNSRYEVTLNSNCSWIPFDTNIRISEVMSSGDTGVNFTVTYLEQSHNSTYGVTCT